MANISKIKLPNGVEYDVYDAKAIHVGDYTAFMDFKGTKSTESDLANITNQKVGDVWLIASTGLEFVWDGSSWVRLGYDIDAASSTHIHGVSTLTGTNAASSVSGTISVPKVTVGTSYIKGSASVPGVTPSSTSVLSSGGSYATTVTPATTNIKATASGTAVGANGTANAITGFGAHATDSALGVNATFAVSGGTPTVSKMSTTTIKNPSSISSVAVPNITKNDPVTASYITSNSDVTIPNVTDVSPVTVSKVSASNGTAASWSASVTGTTLEFSWAANTPTVVTAQDMSVSKVTLGSALSASKVTARDVSATKVTLGTALSASKVSTSNVTVATGSLATDGDGAAVVTGVGAFTVAVDEADTVTAITALGTPTTAKALTGVKVTAQPTVSLSTNATAGNGVISVVSGISNATTVYDGGAVSVLTGVTLGAPTITLSSSSTTSTGAVAVDDVSVSGTVNATHNLNAAAQTWTFKSATLSGPSN
jgi:hypothetical protein